MSRYAWTLVLILICATLMIHIISQWHTRQLDLDPSPYTPSARVKFSDCHVYGPYPDPLCTPGGIFADITAQQVCMKGYTKKVRYVTTAVKHLIYESYGISHHVRGEYEMDHFISLELGGSNDPENLFPEAANPQPGYHQKDLVENYLHEQVCSGNMSLSVAQRKIASDWLALYNAIPNINQYSYTNRHD